LHRNAPRKSEPNHFQNLSWVHVLCPCFCGFLSLSHVQCLSEHQIRLVPMEHTLDASAVQRMNHSARSHWSRSHWPLSHWSQSHWSRSHWSRGVLGASTCQGLTTLKCFCVMLLIRMLGPTPETLGFSQPLPGSPEIPVPPEYVFPYMAESDKGKYKMVCPRPSPRKRMVVFICARTGPAVSALTLLQLHTAKVMSLAGFKSAGW